MSKPTEQFDPEAPTVEQINQGVKFAPGTFFVGGRGYGKTAALRGMKEAAAKAEQERVAVWAKESLGIELATWQRSFIRGALGNWEYTPADELRDRLNDSFQGKPPAVPVNTRYWRS
jgi:hypothetical protein